MGGGGGEGGGGSLASVGSSGRLCTTVCTTDCASGEFTAWAAGQLNALAEAANCSGLSNQSEVRDSQKPRFAQDV